ncbi:type IV secretion system protein VirB10 [Rubrivivax gelatinosus]|uniref:type IV secretion system protein VirB10 n=1 Tax=Rubrivivax gelatinosus TaxID=28068 RepID=UPI001F5B0D71|nr:type IV secretion system protein VirB10 [Rubrivivax gelatinosus]
MEPLAGEPGIPDVASATRRRLPKKGIVAVLLAIGMLSAIAGVAVQHWLGDGTDADDAHQLLAQKPAAAGSARKPLEMPAAPSASSSAAAPSPRIPAIDPSAEVAEPIGVRRTGSASRGRGEKAVAPEDAPVMVVTSRPSSRQATADAPADAGPQDSGSNLRRNLEGYQQHLRGVVDALGRSAGAAGIPAPTTDAATSLTAPAQAAGLFGGQLQGSATPPVAAGRIADRSLTLPKGTSFTCALKTRVVSAASGLVGCMVQRNVYGDNGRVLLIERGSHLDGEYRIASVRPGTVRIPVLWTRVRTPEGVTVDLASPGTGPLGEAGIPGHVDNRWGERIGAAMLLSLIDDSVNLVVQNQTERSGDTIVLPSTTDNTSKLAEKVLDSTINIPPLIYQNQGGIVGVVVARDLDFSSVYELKAVSR